MTAVAHPNVIQTMKAFQEQGFDVNSHNGYHDTVLNAAIGSDDELVLYLLSQRAIFSTKARRHSATQPETGTFQHQYPPPRLLAYDAKIEQDPALHWAAAAGSFEKARILLSHGTDIKALRTRPYDRRGLAKGTPLHEAASAHYTDAKEQILSPLEWDPEEQEQLVNLLLEAGADLQGEDDQGRRPEDWVINGPSLNEAMWKRLAASCGCGATFNEEGAPGADKGAADISEKRQT